jgi:prophage regulatory protein
MEDTSEHKRVLAFCDLRAMGITFTPVGIRWLVRKGRFPRPVRLSANRIVWLADEINGWLTAKIAARDANAGARDAPQAASAARAEDDGGAKPKAPSRVRRRAPLPLQRRPMTSTNREV